MDAKKLNVQLISFDDAINPWPYLTAFKEPIQIPNLQRIAEQSTLFEAAYSQASVCGPSRASLMTGRSTHQLGVHGNEDDIFKLHDPRIVWPYTLKKHGYYCSSGGKVHHGYIKLDPAVHAILYDDDHKFFARDRNIPLYAETTHFGGVQKGIATVHPEDDEKFHDARAAQSAIDFIENYDADQPFYREVGFYSPHGPFYTPPGSKKCTEFRRLRDPWLGMRNTIKQNILKQHSRQNIPLHKKIGSGNKVYGTIFPPTPTEITIWAAFGMR